MTTYLLNDNYHSGLKASIFSEAAIYVLKEIYTRLFKERENCKKGRYDYYKENVEAIITAALSTWKGIYEGEYGGTKILLYDKYDVHDLIITHTNLNLYSKENEKVKEYREQMAIEKANRYNYLVY